MLKNILIIHESSTIRRIVRNYLMCDLDDAALMEGKSPEKALEMIHQYHFYAIISGLEMSTSNGYDIFDEVKKSKPNSSTPFLLISSADTKIHKQEASKRGINHYLPMPFSAKLLTDTIEAITPEKSNRRYKRINISNAKVTIHTDDGDVFAELINISEDGLLCDVSNIHNVAFEDTYLSISLPNQFSPPHINDILCRLMRLNMIEWDANDSPQRIRMVWQILHAQKSEMDYIHYLIEKSDST